MPDHDYKTGGWKDKYIIFRRCHVCGGDGEITECGCRSVGECHHAPTPCTECDQGRRPVEADSQYFVLRLDADPHARVAARAYADSVLDDNLVFARDIRERVRELEED